MEKFIIYFGIILCSMLGVFGNVSVKVSDSIATLPTPDPLIDDKDIVNVALNCTGSSSDLGFYIKNRLNWELFRSDGSHYQLTESFQNVKNVYASPQFDSGHMKLDVVQKPDSMTFALHINGVTHADNGIYRCSLKNEGGDTLDSKELTLTVLNPVESLNIELMNMNMETIGEKTTPMMKDEPPVEATPGEYMVKCTATGSNPAPDMSLYFNEQRPQLTVSTSQDTSGNRVKNSGSFTKKIKLNAHTEPQTLTCMANIPGNHFPMKQAGFNVMVQVDKPDMKCSNVTTRLGDNYAKVMCNISAEGESNAGLVCEKVSWLLGDSNQRLEYDQRWKDPSQKLDIIETACEAGENGLQVSISIFHVKPSHFVEVYYVEYGIGENSHRLPFMLNEDTTAGVSTITASLSLLVCIVMATVAKHLVL